MYDEYDLEDLKKNLRKRLKSLYDLFEGDLISRNTLSSQLLELLSTIEAKTYWDLTMKNDITARRMLTMLEDPEQWEKDSSSPEDEREKVLKNRLADVFISLDQDYQEILERLLDTA
ncbi:MAG: hypothetical protein GF388_09395, partial [Candidatus Aegiribacteria sp.]|nr:hypothetical protein [Candidatus Aegiribacteria sp.]